MTLLESIFVCNNKNDDKDEDIWEIKEEIRELKSEIKSIYREMDLRCESCNNKNENMFNNIDIKFEMLNNKIDNLILLIQSKK